MRTLKAILIFLTIAVFSISAQVPRTINYQGKLTDDSGIAVTGPVSITFRIYSTETGGTPLWSEAHGSVTVTNGLFDVILGEGTPMTIDFDEQYWMELVVGGETLAPREQLAAVPYAHRAVYSDTALVIGSGAVQTTARLDGDGTAGDPLDIAQQGAINGQVLKWNGTSWVPAADNVNDADSDPTNELQTLGVSGNNVTLTDGGSITVPYATTAGSAPPSGTASGDLSGTYPDPTVDGIQGRSVAMTAPTNGQVLKWNNTASQWEPSADATGGSGTVTSIATNNGITGGTITTTGTIGLTGQALALHNLSTNGLIARTGSGTVAGRTITASTGISVTNGNGVSGNPTITNTGVTSLSGGTGISVSSGTGAVTITNDSPWTSTSNDYIRNQTSVTQSAGFRINGNGLFNGGSVGIGTTSPSTDLHIYGSGLKDFALQSTNDDIDFYLRRGGGGAVTRMRFQSGTTDEFLISAVSSGSALSIRSADVIDPSLYILKSNGNVGHATTNPIFDLDVRGIIGANVGTGFITLNPSTSGNATVSFHSGHNLLFNTFAGYGGLGTGTPLMLIEGSTGNVGIGTGTTAPSAKLEVEGGGATAIRGEYDGNCFGVLGTTSGLTRIGVEGYSSGSSSPQIGVDATAYYTGSLNYHVIGLDASANSTTTSGYLTGVLSVVREDEGYRSSAISAVLHDGSYTNSPPGDAALFANADNTGGYAGYFLGGEVWIGDGGTATRADSDGDLFVKNDLEVEGGIELGGTYRTTWPSGGSSYWTDNGTYITPNDNSNIQVRDAGQTRDVQINMTGASKWYGLFAHNTATAYDGSSYQEGFTKSAIAARVDNAGKRQSAIIGWSELGSDSSASILGANLSGTTWGALGYNYGGTELAGMFTGDVSVNGNVGIGTTAPNRLLEVSGSGEQYMRVTSTSGSSAGIEFLRPGVGSYDWRIYDTGGNLRFAWSGDDFSTVNDVMHISFTSGRVGIGHTSPTQMLDVDGQIRVRGGSTPAVGDVLTATSTDGTADWQTPSAGGSPGGADTHVQYNDGGAFGGSSTFTWDNTNARLGINLSSSGEQAHLNVRQTSNPISGNNIILANLAADFRQNSSSNGYGSGIKFTVGNSDSYTGTAAIVAERTGSWSQGRLHFAVNDAGASGKTDIPIAMTIDGPDGGNVSTGKINSVVVVDGTNHATIQDAIDALPSSGGKVFVPSGTYTLTSAISISSKSNITIEGAGNSTIITSGAGTNFYRFEIYRSTGIVIKDMTIRSPDRTQFSNYGVYINESSECVVKNCSFIDCSRGIYIYTNNSSYPCAHNKIAHNHFESCVYGVYSYSGVYAADSDPDAHANRFNIIEHNTFNHNDVASSRGIYIYFYNYGFTVIGNTVRNTASHGIDVVFSRGHVISGNNVLNAGTNGIHFQGANASVISNNVVRQSSGDGIRGLSSPNIAIIGNTILESGGSYSVYASSCNYATVVGNSADLGRYLSGTGLSQGNNTP